MDWGREPGYRRDMNESRLAVGAVLGLLFGAFVGWVAHFLSRLQGVWALAVPMGLIGLAVGAVAARVAPYRPWKQVRLSEAEIEVPGLSTLKFVIDGEQRKVAWRIFVEMMTRVSTQPLEPGAGFVEEALESLHGLFTTTRGLLKEMLPSPVIAGTHRAEELAILMLNRELRPFLSVWHPRWKTFAAGGAGGSWREDTAFRDELAALRARLLEYAKSFGALAEIEELNRYFGK
jgi:hypothetical protein